MKILLLLSTLLIFSCSNKLEKQIIENNKNVDFDIYENVINDSSLYFFFPEDHFDSIKYIINKTKRWEYERFHLSTKNLIGEFLRDEDELSDKNTTYLFSEVESIISNNEKKALANFSQTIALDSINYNFKNFEQISNNERFEGICLEISKPIYSSDSNFAFLDIYLHKNLSKRTLDTTTYYEKIGVILNKDLNGQWKLYKKKVWIML